MPSGGDRPVIKSAAQKCNCLKVELGFWAHIKLAFKSLIK